MRFFPNLREGFENGTNHPRVVLSATRFRKGRGVYETAELDTFCWNHLNSKAFTGILSTSLKLVSIHFQKEEFKGRSWWVRVVHLQVKKRKSSDRGHLLLKHPSKDELIICIILNPGESFSRHAFTSIKLMAVALKAAKRSLSAITDPIQLRRNEEKKA